MRRGLWMGSMVGVAIGALALAYGCDRDTVPSSMPDVPAPLGVDRRSAPRPERVRVVVPPAPVESDPAAHGSATRAVVGLPPTTPDGPAPVPAPEAAPGPLVAVELVVVDEGGALVPGARVTAFVDKPRSHYSAWREVATHVTDALGRVDCAADEGQAVRFRAETDGGLAAATEVIHRFGGASRRRVVLALAEGVRSRGRVLDRDTQRPIAGARVHLHHPPWSQELVTDADGRFVTGPLPAIEMLEDARPYVSAVGYRADSVRAARVGGEWTITLSAATTVEFRLIRPDGTPLARCSGYVKAQVGRTGDLFEGDADGRVRIDVTIDPGAVVEVRPRGWAFVTFDALPERVAERDLRDIVVRKAGRVEGTVVDSGGRPVHGALVKVRPVTGGYARDLVRTDIDGLFELEHVGPGEHVVVAEARGASVRTEQTVRAGARDVRLVVATLPGDD